MLHEENLYCHSRVIPIIQHYFGQNANHVFIQLRVAPGEPISTKGQVAWEGLASNFSMPANAPPIVKPCINSHWIHKILGNIRWWICDMRLNSWVTLRCAKARVENINWLEKTTMIYEIGILYHDANLNWNSWAQKFNLVWLRELFKEVWLWTYADYVECNNIIAERKLPSNTVIMQVKEEWPVWSRTRRVREAGWVIRRVYLSLIQCTKSTLHLDPP